VQILTPVPQDFVGPGTVFRVQTDFVGPIELGSKYQVALSSSPEAGLLARASRLSQTSQETLWLGIGVDPFGILQSDLLEQPGVSAFPTPASATVALVSPTNTVLDQTAIQLKWQPTAAGVGWIQQFTTSSTPVEGGFTETDRVTLNTTATSVTSLIPLTTSVPGTIGIGLEQLQKGPPIDLLSEGEELLLTGRGTLTRSSGTAGVYAYGGRWNVEIKPTGLGQLDGQVVKYEQRIAQFVVVKARLGGGLYAFSVDDSHYDSGETTWPIPFPVRIDYDILPGVTVRWRWLLFLQ
jgi:hypothetical protein